MIWNMCRLPHLWVGVWFCGLVDGWVFLLTFWYLTAYLKHLIQLQGYFLGLCLGRTAEKGMTWLWRDLLKTYFTELVQLKYKLIISIKTIGCCGLACVVWLKSCEFSKRKSVLIVRNSSMMCLLQKFLNLTYMWTFFIFYETEWTCWVFLLPIRSLEHLKEIQAFEAAIWCHGDQ